MFLGNVVWLQPKGTDKHYIPLGKCVTGIRVTNSTTIYLLGWKKMLNTRTKFLVLKKESTNKAKEKTGINTAVPNIDINMDINSKYIFKSVLSV